jgi:hypothetical protein
MCALRWMRCFKMVVVQALKNERERERERETHTHTHTHTHKEEAVKMEEGIIGTEKYDSCFLHGQNLVTSNYGRFEV